MRAKTAYLAGLGAVAVAIAAGLSGGQLFSNIVAPHQPKYVTEPTKLELRMAERSMPVTSLPSEPASAIAVMQPTTTVPVVCAAPVQIVPQSRKEVAPPPAEQKAALIAVQPATSTGPSLASSEQAAYEPSTTQGEAFARTRGADLKRAATEKRRADRQQPMGRQAPCASAT
jgi:hypothetical protein